MKLQKSVKYDENYLSKIVDIQRFADHINPEVTRLKVAHVDGYNVIVGIDEAPGKFVYFPTMSCINPQLLAFANLYRHKELNENPEKTGMFEDNGRVKAIKLKGQTSEGFLLPVQTLVDFIVASTSVAFDESDCPVGTEFNEVEHKGKTFWISKKYVIKEAEQQAPSGDRKDRKRQKGLKKFNRLIDNQFRLHYSTTIIRKEPNTIAPNDLIHISSKWDGTSAVYAYVLCKHPLTWKEKIAKWLTGKEPVDYDYVYSSRSVIKNANITLGKVNPGFYGEGADVWGESFKVIKPYLTKGMTIYAEIVGYLPNGKRRQRPKRQLQKRQMRNIPMGSTTRLWSTVLPSPTLTVLSTNSPQGRFSSGARWSVLLRSLNTTTDTQRTFILTFLLMLRTMASSTLTTSPMTSVSTWRCVRLSATTTYGTKVLSSRKRICSPGLGS